MDSPLGTEALNKIIGNKIKYLRKINEITQVELKKELGFTSTGTISQVENGKKGLKLASLMKVAKIFGVHPAVLISPVDITDYNDFIILSKVIHLIEIKRERPEVAKPLLGAINGLLEHLPGEY
jgi:transcriptional regulator with XRE-family HTH domain